MSEPAHEVEEPETETEPEPTEPTPEEQEEGETSEPTPEPEPETEPGEGEPGEPVDESERCEAETTAGGNRYRCSLQAEHEGEHAFQPLDAGDSGEPADPLESPEARKRMKSIRDRGDKLQRDITEFATDYSQPLFPCPRCADGFPGHCWHPDAVEMSEEEKVQVRLSIGDTILPEYQPDKYRETCETCGGHGKVLTGSHVASQGTIACDDCGGKGWTDKRGEKAPPAAPAPVIAGPWEAAPEPEGEPDARTLPDSFGTPPGAPYYGVMLHLRPDGWEQEVAAWKVSQGLS